MRNRTFSIYALIDPRDNGVSRREAKAAYREAEAGIKRVELAAQSGVSTASILRVSHGALTSKITVIKLLWEPGRIGSGE